MDITAEQEQSENGGGNDKNSVSVHQKIYQNPYERNNPNRLNHCLYPKWIMNSAIFTTYSGKKQNQQTKNGENRAHLINYIGLYHREITPFSIKTGKRKYFRDQPFRFATGKIGAEQHHSGNEEDKARNFPTG